MDTVNESVQYKNVQLPPAHFHAPIPRPLEHDLPQQINELLKKESHLEEPNFKFEVSDHAALFNWDLLSSNDFNLEQLLNTKNNSITSYGSDFNQYNNWTHYYASIRDGKN
jgi:hypothetical protein